jgi:hypothetical protein
MPDTPDTQGSIFDQLSESFEKKVDQLIDISVLPEHIAEFLQTAKPDEISLLNVALTEHSFGRMSLAECMKASIEGQEREARADADSGEAASGSQEPNSLIKETPTIEYSLKARLESHFEEDLDRVELTLDEYQALKRALGEMRSHAKEAA